MRTPKTIVASLLRDARARVNAALAEFERRGWGCPMLSPYADYAWTLRAYRNAGSNGIQQRVVFLAAEQVACGDLIELFFADLPAALPEVTAA
jgi:hypothetical protein